MSAMTISVVVFACVFGGALLGMLLRAMLPQHHLSSDSKDVVKLGMGLVGTLAALVLGLQIGSAKGSFDAQSRELTEFAANVGLLDRLLIHYGSESGPARDLLRGAVATFSIRCGQRTRRMPPRPERSSAATRRCSTRYRDSRRKTTSSERSRPKRCML